MIIAQSSSATEKLAVDTTLDEIRHRVNKETVTTQIDEFIEVISSDGFLDYVNGVGELPTYSERRAHTSATASVPTLRSYGVPTPDGLRLTTREFELPEDGLASATPLVQVRPGLDPRMGFCVSIGYIICASFGG
jgi:hypothetical protein